MSLHVTEIRCCGLRKGELWWGGAGPGSGPRQSSKRSQQKRPVQGYLDLVIQSPYQCTTSHFLSEIPHIRIIYKLRNTLKIQTAMYFVSSWSFFFFSRSLLFLSIIHIFLVKIATGNKRVGNLLKVTEATLVLSQPLSELLR